MKVINKESIKKSFMSGNVMKTAREIYRPLAYRGPIRNIFSIFKFICKVPCYGFLIHIAKFKY